MQTHVHERVREPQLPAGAPTSPRSLMCLLRHCARGIYCRDLDVLLTLRGIDIYCIRSFGMLGMPVATYVGMLGVFGMQEY